MISFWYTIVLVAAIIISQISSHWIVVWIILGLSSISMIPIISRNTTPRAVEASVKYFIFQALASAILLGGILVRYINIGTFGTEGIYTTVEGVFILLALVIKIGLFPAHFWFIDVVSGLQFYQCFYVIVISKLIPLIFIINISTEFLSNAYLIVGCSSVLIGSVLGTSQVQTRKIMAFSSVAHLGWIVIIIPYTNYIVPLLLFSCYIVVIGLALEQCNNMSLYSIGNARKQSQSSEVLLFLISLISLGAFPPTIGFLYKWIMFIIIIKEGLFMVAAFLIIMSVISLYFYLNLAFNIFSIYWPVNKSVVLSGVSNQNGLSITIGLVIIFPLFFLGPITNYLW
uniref:NADH-ubiquinone oxidoreductase chain 2 n=1 Tax=Aspidophiura sp. TaxID=3135528 RepID=A0AAU6QCH7_9ECHI